MATQSEEQPTMDPIRAYAEYPFDDDEIYQLGLANILAGRPNPTLEELEDTYRNTRVYYLSTVKGYDITIAQARAYDESRKQARQASYTAAAASASASEEENRVLTFAELKEMIETGNVDKIPNNKVIPERLNDAPPSQSTAPSRKKPWEKDQ